MNTFQRCRNVWRSICHRCHNPNHQDYPTYGDRGITVCDRWKIFRNFYDDLGPIPKGMTVDRIDNDKGYCPENCRLVDAKTQANNRRSNRFITHKGKTQSLALWSDESGIPYGTLQARLDSKWPVEKALTQPVRPLKRMITFNGKTQMVSDWAKEIGIAANTLTRRLDTMEFERAMTMKCAEYMIPSNTQNRYYIRPSKGYRVEREVYKYKGAEKEYISLRIITTSGQNRRFGKYDTRQDAIDVAEAVLSGKAF